jgi:hypothetical protein
MSKQTEVKIGALRVPASAAIIALTGTTAQGRAANWDAAAGTIELCIVDEFPEFIIDDVHDDDTATVIPFTSERNFRVQLDAALTAALGLGDYIKVDDGGAGKFDSGGAAADVNVGRVEEAAAAGGLALVRPLKSTVTT